MSPERSPILIRCGVLSAPPRRGAGCHPKALMDLARHSGINLTMQTTSHAILSDRGAALDALPDLLQPAQAAKARATGADERDRLCHLLSRTTLIDPDYSGLSRTTERAESREGEDTKDPGNMGGSGHIGGAPTIGKARPFCRECIKVRRGNLHPLIRTGKVVRPVGVRGDQENRTGLGRHWRCQARKQPRPRKIPHTIPGKTTL